MLKGSEIVKIIKEAKEAGVSELTIGQNGDVKVIFNKKPESFQVVKEQVNTVELDKLMADVAQESAEEEADQITDEMIAEWELNAPHKIDEHILLGDLVETPDGRITLKEDK